MEYPRSSFAVKLHHICVILNILGYNFFHAYEFCGHSLSSFISQNLLAHYVTLKLDSQLLSIVCNCLFNSCLLTAAI
jgi:hypothetical protein